MSVIPAIVGLHHAQIIIPTGAEEQGKAFYCGVLGMPEIEKPEPLKVRGGFWLQVGDRQLHIGTQDDAIQIKTKAHLAYEVRDLPRWRSRLENSGVKIIDSIPVPGYQRMEFRDPFGNRVELIEPV